jgi:hypothetical protein
MRTASGLGAALVLATGVTLLTGTAAHAQSVVSGTLSFSGDAGDYISGGQSYSYSTATNDTLNVTGSTDDRTIDLSVSGANGDWWYLDLQAPQGQTLTAGQYTGATRYPFNTATEPGLSLTGNGRGCNTVTGSFTINDIVFGPNGYVQTLDATFEQHCEGGTAAARGSVHIANPVPPPALTLGVGVGATGTASALNGNATVKGTVTCDKAASVAVSGQVTQVKHNIIVRGSYNASVACVAGKSVPWTATAVPTGTTPFSGGDVQVQAQAQAQDVDYGNFVTVNKTATVRLSRVAR